MHSQHLAPNLAERLGTMFAIYFVGTLRVLIDEASGAVVAVQNRVTGAAASFTHSPEVIASAVASASRAFASQDEAFA